MKEKKRTAEGNNITRELFTTANTETPLTEHTLDIEENENSGEDQSDEEKQDH